MWRLADGLPEISQATIGSYIGCSTSGSTGSTIAQGVNFFTATHDAYWDIPGGLGDPSVIQAQFFSRQITSIDSGVPVIALVNGGLHAGVVDGGKWHDDPYNINRHIWDYVYFHDPDPAGGPDLYWAAGSWLTYVSTQVISGYVSAAADSNFLNYGDGVVVRGHDWPPGDWPPEM